MSKLQKAALFIEAVGMKENFEKNISAEVDNAINEMKHDPLIKDLKKMAEDLKELAKTETDDLLGKVTDLIADMFTEEELDTVLQFHATPIGKRLLQALPTLFDRSDDLARSWLSKASAKIWASHLN